MRHASHIVISITSPGPKGQLPNALTLAAYHIISYHVISTQNALGLCELATNNKFNQYPCFPNSPSVHSHNLLANSPSLAYPLLDPTLATGT